MLDLILAVLHHILVFGLVAMVAAERVLLRTEPTPVDRLARLDAGVGGAAMLVLVVGVCRVIWGGKGWTFYEMNPFFWAKILTFGLIAAASIIPTVRFMAWRRARKIDPAFQPDPADLVKVRRVLTLEVLLLAPLLAFAAATSKWPF
jgi:putative membrane protein